MGTGLITDHLETFLMQLEVAQGSRLDRGAPAGALMLERDLPAELAPFQAPKTLIFTQKYFYLCIFGKEIQWDFFFPIWLK